MTPTRESFADLFRRLIDDTIHLVRSEVLLARSEVSAKITAAIGSIAAIAIGSALAMVASTCLIVAGIAALAERVGLVAAALIVGGGLAAIAATLIIVGMSRLRRLDLAPTRSVANLKRDVKTLQGD